MTKKERFQLECEIRNDFERLFERSERQTRSVQSSEWIPYSYSNNFPPTSSTKLSAVGKCLRLYSDFLLQIPLEPADHYLSMLLKKPNVFDTKKTFFEKLVYQTLLNGNFHAKIDYDSRGQVIALLPFNPASMYAYPVKGEYTDPISIQRHGFYYRDFKGRSFMPDEIFHLKDMMFSNSDQLNGLSRIYVYQTIFEAGGGLENVACSFARSGLRKTVMLTPNNISEVDKDTLKNAREQVEEFYKKAGTAGGGVMTLPVGFDLKSLNFDDPERLFEFLSNKNSLDIARIFSVPIDLVSKPASDKSGGMNHAKEAHRFFIRTSLRAFLKNISDALEMLAMDGTDFSFQVDKFIASDRREESQYISQLVQSGVLSAEDAKEMINI